MASVNFTSSLPKELIELLDLYAGKFRLPKNRIIEQALVAYFEKLKKAEYAHSFRRAASDEEQVLIAEEGLEDYLKIISEE
ncbi:MAG: ribbon-helix-helix domain-containing protein [Bacteroidales bacterium]|nr:ribbon-helix-helix domain-containing protein [Bacteroidales bacterium]